MLIDTENKALEGGSRKIRHRSTEQHAFMHNRSHSDSRLLPTGHSIVHREVSAEYERCHADRTKSMAAYTGRCCCSVNREREREKDVGPVLI